MYAVAWTQTNRMQIFHIFYNVVINQHLMFFMFLKGNRQSYIHPFKINMKCETGLLKKLNQTSKVIQKYQDYSRIWNFWLRDRRTFTFEKMAVKLSIVRGESFTFVSDISSWLQACQQKWSFLFLLEWINRQKPSIQIDCIDIGPSFRYAQFKQGYTLENWLEGLSDEA